MSPPKKRTCLTPRNEREADQRQQTSDSVKTHRLGIHLDLDTPEVLPRERGNGPTTRSACNAHKFDENKVDARVKTHCVETLMLYVNIAILYDGKRRNLLLAVRMVHPPHPPLS